MAWRRKDGLSCLSLHADAYVHHICFVTTYRGEGHCSEISWLTFKCLLQCAGGCNPEFDICVICVI